MTASELSEHPFGHKACDVPGHESVWVRFKTSGYPRKLRREWDATSDADGTWAIVMRYVTDWHLVDVDGAPVELPAGERPVTLVDNVEDAVVSWLMRAFTTFWLAELVAPRKN